MHPKPATSAAKQHWRPAIACNPPSDEAIQNDEDDGKIFPDLLRYAHDRRSDSSIAVSVADTLFHKATTFRDTLKDPTPAESPHDLLKKLIPHFFAEKESLDISMAALS